MMVNGNWNGLIRYSLKDGDTYLGFMDQRGWNGKMIKYVNTYCMGLVYKNGKYIDEHFDMDMTLPF